MRAMQTKQINIQEEDPYEGLSSQNSLEISADGSPSP